MKTPASPKVHRRHLLLGALAGAATAAPLPAWSSTTARRFDRTAYDRYVSLMNAGDPRVVDYYADDIRFVMGIRGKAQVSAFYARQRPYVKENLEVLFFCADANGAAAEVRSEIRCMKDCDDPAVFGRTLKAGEILRTHGYLFYVLDQNGLIAEIKGPPPELLGP